MFASKSTLFAVLLLAVDVLGARITYANRYKYRDERGVEKEQWNTKNGGTITDADGEDILKHVHEWNNQYTAKQNANTKIITVDGPAYANKDGSVKGIQDMEHLVKQHK